MHSCGVRIVSLEFLKEKKLNAFLSYDGCNLAMSTNCYSALAKILMGCFQVKKKNINYLVFL